VEASVAEALRGGEPLGDYARERKVSINTVYTHLRRIKDKTGANRLPNLIRRLNDLHLPLRFD
jgi:DNA-binding CsgD family transcriptional regulator